MKRVSNLYFRICSVENLELADHNARRHKMRSIGVRIHDQKRNSNILALHETLVNKIYKTSPYHVFKVKDPKEREIYQLPYYPDRIVHHAIMNVLEPIWMNVFTQDTYSCIKGRGIHKVLRKLKEDLKDPGGTIFCLKMDIRKYYPSIDHFILKKIIRRKIKDKDTLWLLDSIIDSAPGVPIGNYLSQYFANLYLAYFDHWLKETKQIRYYYRYADDMVILHSDKNTLHELRSEIQEYLWSELKLNLKGNYQVFPVESRGIDFVGYRFYHTHILLRKSIKKNFARSIARNGKYDKEGHAAYWGWAKHCNSHNLIRKLSA